jgi:uncharacterized protein (DUF433 family)
MSKVRKIVVTPSTNKRITVDSEICNGKPVIRGMRITVETILGYLNAGDSVSEILEHYPMLEAEDIEACRGAR